VSFQLAAKLSLTSGVHSLRRRVSSGPSQAARPIGSPTLPTNPATNPKSLSNRIPPGAGKYRISADGGVQPRWRKDGQELFYIAGDGKLMAVDIKTSPKFEAGIPKALFDPNIFGGSAAQSVFRYDVTPDGKRFLVNSDPKADQKTGLEPFTVILNWRPGPMGAAR
jgi:hypothetical protein